VLKAGTSSLHYYCGSCEHAWVESGGGFTPLGDGDGEQPDRSRPGQLPDRDRRKTPPARRPTSRGDRRSRR
jgi:hypothetical protein